MLHCSRAGSSPRAANSSLHQERAKKPRSSAIGSRSTMKTPGSSAGVKITRHAPANGCKGRSDNVGLGDGDDEPAPLAPVRGLLLQDLVGEVPRQQEDV